MKHTFEPNEKWVTRFWSKVDRDQGADGCWIWTAGKFKTGYGQVGRPNAKGTMSTHRAAFFLTGGEVTKEASCVLHSCHNRACVNPAHLRAGSYQDNVDDMHKAGRNSEGDNHYSRTNPEKLARGDKNGSRTRPECLRRGANHPLKIHPEKAAKGENIGTSKLTSADVTNIRKLYAAGELQYTLARMHGVSQSQVSDIVLRKSWRHLP